MNMYQPRESHLKSEHRSPLSPVELIFKTKVQLVNSNEDIKMILFLFSGVLEISYANASSLESSEGQF